MNKLMVASTTKNSQAIYTDHYIISIQQTYIQNMKNSLQTKNIYDHKHLLLKQFKQSLKKSNLDLKPIISSMNINYYDLHNKQMKEVLHEIVDKVKQSQNYHLFQAQVQQRLIEEANNMYSSDSKKMTYLIDCYKESVSFPFVKTRGNNYFNYSSLYKQLISRQLRRATWIKQFNIDYYRQMFQKLDKQIAPYKIYQQMLLVLNKIVTKEGLSIKQHQIDIILRIMQYFVKYYQKIPNKYHNYIVLSVVQLYSYYTLGRIIDIGAITLGLIGLAEQYYQKNTEKRIKNILKAIEIVDPSSLQHISLYYFNSDNENQTKRQLNECFQLFRLTLGGNYLNIETNQFLIDQLISKKYCKLDIYIMFAIMILIISDQFDPEEPIKPNVKEIIERAKDIIKTQDFYDAFKVIFQGISYNYSLQDLETNPKNKLLLWIFEEKQQNINKQGQQTQQQNFVILLDSKARIGNKI